MRWTQAVLILSSVGLSACAQVLLKAGASSGARAPAESPDVVTGTLALLASPATIAGLVVYGVSALLWLRVLAGVALSQAYPYVALGIVLTTLAGVVVFQEPLVASRMAGTALILGGVLLVGYR